MSIYRISDDEFAIRWGILKEQGVRGLYKRIRQQLSRKFKLDMSGGWKNMKRI